MRQIALIGHLFVGKSSGQTNLNVALQLLIGISPFLNLDKRVIFTYLGCQLGRYLEYLRFFCFYNSLENCFHIAKKWSSTKTLRYLATSIVTRSASGEGLARLVCTSLSKLSQIDPCLVPCPCSRFSKSERFFVTVSSYCCCLQKHTNC